MKFFCSQCREEHDIEKYDDFATKTGNRMAKVLCPVCGLLLYRRIDTTYQIGEKKSSSA